MPNTLAWGAKVSPLFRQKAIAIATRIQVQADDLMSCIAFESGETFRANVKNAAGSGAVGLIQIMPKTARDMGTTTTALAAMTPEDQLDWVERYFRPYVGRMRSLSDLYMAILWPAAVGKPESHVLWTAAKSPVTYGQNKGLDKNRDGVITKAEAAAKVHAKLIRGMLPGHLWIGGSR